MNRNEAAEARQLVDTLAGMFQQLFRKRLIAYTQANIAELALLQELHGDAGTAAFYLGVPVEDVLRVSGS